MTRRTVLPDDGRDVLSKSRVSRRQGILLRATQKGQITDKPEVNSSLGVTGMSGEGPAARLVRVSYCRHPECWSD
jgi:hypothetical protein